MPSVLFKLPTPFWATFIFVQDVIVLAQNFVKFIPVSALSRFLYLGFELMLLYICEGLNAILVSKRRSILVTASSTAWT